MSREVAGFHAKLLQRVRIGQRVPVVAQTGHVDSAVQVEADHRSAAVDAAIDHNLRGRQADDEIWRAAGIAARTSAVGLHARRQGKLGIRVSVDQGQADDFGWLNRSSQFRGSGLH